MTEQEFSNFASGDEKALHQFYIAHFGYVTGRLLYKEKCPKDRVREMYNDAVLAVRDRAMSGNLRPDNLLGFLLVTASNCWKMELRRQSSLLKRHERYLEQLPDNIDDTDFDNLIRSEEETGLEVRRQRHTLALRQALSKLSDACRELLTDTIINGLKVGGLAEKFGLKDARGVTAKKQDCKGQLERQTLHILQQNGWANNAERSG